jgi:hypothetical protein
MQSELAITLDGAAKHRAQCFLGIIQCGSWMLFVGGAACVRAIAFDEWAPAVGFVP